MRSTLLAAAVPVLALTVGVNARPAAATRFRAESCNLTLRRGDTLDFAGVAANGRTTARVKIWSDSIGVLSYTEAQQNDSIPIRANGTIWLDRNGLPYRFARRDAFGSQVNTESVERVDSTIVTIRNSVQTLTAAVPDGIPMPQALGPVPVMLLAQCVWHQSGRALRTSRGDSIRIREAVTAHVNREGREPKRVTLFVVTARGVNDYYARVWLDEQGRFFATRFIDGADMVLPREWKSSVVPLLLAGIGAAEPRMRATADSLGRRSPAGTAITHATILDVEQGRAIPGMSVLVEGSVIRTIAPDSTFSAPAGALIVDARGATLMPGLWDLNDREGGPDWDGRTRRRLAGGVTSIQVMFPDTVFAPRTARRIDDGGQIGPRLFLGCPLDGWYPDTVPGAVPGRRQANGQMRSPTDVRQSLRRCAGHGIRWTMLNDNLPAALTSVAIEEAHRLGLRVTGNRLRGRTSTDLIGSGYDQFEHALQAVTSLVDHKADSVAWLRHTQGGINSFWNTGAALAQLNLQSVEVQRVVALMSEKRIGVKSTLCVYPPIGRSIPHDTTWDRASFAKLQELSLVLHRGGVPVLAATDGACELTSELELLHAAGFTNRELLKMATLDAAGAMGREHDLGSIAVGKRADLILIDGDPLASITALKKIKAVMKDGTLYTNLDALRAELPYLLPRR